MSSLPGVQTSLPAGGAAGSLELGAAAVSVLVGSGTAGVVGVSVLVPAVPLVVAASFFLRLNRDLTLSMMSEAGEEKNG